MTNTVFKYINCNLSVKKISYTLLNRDGISTVDLQEKTGKGKGDRPFCIYKSDVIFSKGFVLPTVYNSANRYMHLLSFTSVSPLMQEPLLYLDKIEK